MQPHFLHSSSFLFDLGLRQSIHFYFLSLWNLLEPILDKTRLKGDPVFVIFTHYKMINLDSITKENNKEHSEKWPFIPDHPYRILIIGGYGSGKANALLNLINEQDDIAKILFVRKRFNWT